MARFSLVGWVNFTFLYVWRLGTKRSLHGVIFLREFILTPRSSLDRKLNIGVGIIFAKNILTARFSLGGKLNIVLGIFVSAGYV